MTSHPRVLFGVTSDVSLTLMQGFPEYLAQRGWDVHIVSAPGPALETLSHLDGITTHAIPMVRNPSPWADFKALLAWIRLLRRVRPDLMSVGTPKAGLLGSLAGLATRSPNRIYHLRGLRLESASGFNRGLLTFLERVSVASSHQVLAVSKSLRQKAIDLRIVSPGKIVVLGAGSSNGVDLGRFQRTNFGCAELGDLSEDLGLEEGIPVIGFVGRLTEDKGLGVLADALEIIAHNGIDYQLLVVGGVEGQRDDTLLLQLSTTGRKPSFTGQVADTAIYYQLMDVLCLPTFREGFPNVVLEAGASGVPALTTTATGAADSVVHGHTGLIANVSSSIQLAEQLAELIGDQELREKLGNQARLHVTANFDQHTVWSLIYNYYSALLLPNN